VNMEVEARLTLTEGRLAGRDGHTVVITSRVGMDLKGLRKEESKERNKLEVGDHDSKRDSRQDSLGDNEDTKRGFLFLRKQDGERLAFMCCRYGMFREMS
jgi:hypothetical protein